MPDPTLRTLLEAKHFGAWVSLRPVFKPLVKAGLLTEINGVFVLTAQGHAYIDAKTTEIRQGVYALTGESS